MSSRKLSPIYQLKNGSLYAPPSGSIKVDSQPMRTVDLYLIYDTHGMKVNSASGTVKIGAWPNEWHMNYTVYAQYTFVKIVNNVYKGEYVNSSGLVASSTDFNVNDAIYNTGVQHDVEHPFTIAGTSAADENKYLCLHLKITVSMPNMSLQEIPELDIDTEGSGSGSGSGGSNQDSVKVTPSSPSGGGVSFSTNTTLSWSISSIPDGCTYKGTQIQMTYATDTTGSRIFYDEIVSGLTTQHPYSGNLSPNTSYIWRTRAVIEQTSSSGSSSTVYDGEYLIEERYNEETGEYEVYDPYAVDDDDSSTIATPWSDWKSFTTKDFEYVSVRVNTSSPENNASFVKGKEIQFRWSINGGSGAIVQSSTLMVDGSAFATIDGTGTSYTYRETDNRLSIGAHVWYISISTSTDHDGILLTGSQTSDRCTFYVNPPTAKASPSSPSGSTTVYADAPVTFSWTISKDGDGSYTGSQLEFRYSTETTWRYLGKTEKGITSFTYQSGFSENTVVQWHVRTSLDGIYSTDGGWSEPMSFTVGNAEIFKATPSLIQPKGTVKGDQEITFAWTVKSDAPVTSCELECSTDGGINWEFLTRINKNLDMYTYKPTRMFPVGTVEYRVRAKANDTNYGDWVQSSFTVSYDAYGKVVAESVSVRSAIRRDQQLEIRARLEIVGQTVENITFANSSFCWRMASGTDYHEEAMATSGVSANIYLPANKFSNGVMYWYLKAEDSKGNKSETEVNATYVLVSGIDTFPIDPQSIIHEASDPLTFTWGFIAQNANLSKLTEVQFSNDGVNYSTPIVIDPLITRNTVTIYNPENALTDDLYTGIGRYTFDADYFSAGRVYWQIRSTSSDGVAGGWSDPALFIARGVPKIQSFTCDEKPFTTFEWVANEQSSYSVTIDDALYYGPFHGDASSFTLPEPLEDGVHIAVLQVENHLGAMSNEARMTFRVRNIASVASSLKLLVSAKIDAILRWHPISISDDNEFLVYRDSTLIARLESDASTYSDRLALGTHTYKVIQRLSNNYYDVYIHAPVTLHSDVTRIGLLEGESWFDLVLTKDPYPTNDYTHKRIIEKTRIMGTKYPVIEVSEFEEKGGSYAVCWPFENYAQADLFNLLIGQAIIVKSRADMVLCGVLESCDISVNSQYVECTFSLDQMSTDNDLSIAAKKSDFISTMTDLDTIYFGQMSNAKLRATTTNPGYTDPKYYEEIAKAINERIRSNPFPKGKN